MKRIATIAALPVLALMVPAAARAQAADPTETPQDEAPASTAAQPAGDDILVTARRREERLQDVPVAISAVSGDTLQSRAITSVEGLRFAVPALVISPSPFGAASPGYTIRSQRQLESIISQDPSVGIYFADIVQQRPQGTNVSLYDIASAQVLKGPQGTLFGRNTTGGAVLITPARPVFDPGASIAITVGDYGQRVVTGVANLPLSSKLAMRVAGNLTRRNGFFDNVATGLKVDSQRTESGRVSLLWEPDDRFSSLTIGTYFHEDDAGLGFFPYTVRPGSAAAATPGYQAEFAAAQRRGDRTVSNNLQPVVRIESYSASNTSTLKLGEVTLKNIFGYRNVKTFGSFDFDASAVTLFESRNDFSSEQWTEEFQLLGKIGPSIDFITGAYWFNERGRDTQNSVLFGTRANDGLGDNTSYSVFAQGDWKLSRALTLTLGARYTWDERSLFTFNRLNGQCRLTATNVPVGSPGAQRLDPCIRHTAVDFRAPTWLATLSWRPVEDVMLYGTYSRGYRSGGLPLRANLPAETRPFAPEFVDNFELGLKSELLDRRVRFNIAAYYDKYRDIQRTLSFGSPLTTVVLNAADAKIWGGEADLMVRPANWLELNATAAYSKNEYGSFTGPGLGDLSGNRFAFAPEFVYTLGGRLIAPMPDASGELSVRLDWFHQSSIFVTDINDIPIPAYGTLDAGAEWRDVLGRPFDLRVFVKNVTDEHYFSGGVSSYPSTGLTGFFPGAPRHFGVEFKAHFGSVR